MNGVAWTKGSVMSLVGELGHAMATVAAFLLPVLGVSGCAEEFDVTRNLSYDSSIGIYGTFDFYEPGADSARANRPAILAIHGGAWRGGDKAWGKQIAEEFCPFGYVVFSINYRLSSQPNGTWPAQIEDVQNALKHIRANARHFRIDPDRIASLGMSAGGHLATMVALRDDPESPDGRVNTAINLDGEHDMTMPPEQVMADFEDILTAVLGHAPPWSDAELRDISTVTFARPDVSLLTVHGAGDDNVYVTQAERITAELQSRGAETESFESRAPRATATAIAGRFPEPGKRSTAFWIVSCLTTATGSSRTGTARDRELLSGDRIDVPELETWSSASNREISSRQRAGTKGRLAVAGASSSQLAASPLDASPAANYLPVTARGIPTTTPGLRKSLGT